MHFRFGHYSTDFSIQSQGKSFDNIIPRKCIYSNVKSQERFWLFCFFFSIDTRCPDIPDFRYRVSLIWIDNEWRHLRSRQLWNLHFIPTGKKKTYAWIAYDILHAWSMENGNPFASMPNSTCENSEFDIGRSSSSCSIDFLFLSKY